MLMVPAFRYFPEFRVTAYQDDTQFWKFYLIPDYVSMRRDINGNPVFLLIKYAFGDQDRAEDPNLPRGGGFMVFDVEMSVREADYPKIVARLQQDVNDTWNQLKAIAEGHGQPIEGVRLHSTHKLPGVSTSVSIGVQDVLLGLGPEGPGAPPGDTPPKVIISQPTWTEGTFKISAPQSEALVSHRVAEGKVSLIGNNVVAANMDLTPAGATFMEKTLTNLDGSGATDLVPIQVTYELKYWARVPPVKMYITADSRSVYESVKVIAHNYEGRGCDEDTMSHSEQDLSIAVQSGLINVQLDAGTLELSDDFLQELRGSALKFVMDMVKDKFFDKKPPPPPPADDKTADFVSRDSDVYYAKSEFNSESMHIAYNEEIKSLTEWPANPQGTLQSFLAGVSPAEMRKYVRVVDLDDPFFKTLGLTATCFADWAAEPIAFVECQVRYSGRDENNLDVEKVQTFTFTKDHTTDTWDPSLIGKKREYSYRWRVGYFGREPGEFTSWERDTTPRLNLSIADTGKVAIKILSGNVDFAQITKTVQVDLQYADAGSDVPDEAITLVLANGQQEQNYQRYIYTQWDRPVRYRTRFFLKNDQTIESDWKDTLSRQLIINEPTSYHRLDVQLVPAGDWEGVVQTVVNLRYVDEAGGYFLEGVYALKSLDEFKAWAVVLKDPNKRKFQYKILTSFKDGSPPSQTGWIEADGDQSLPIVVRQNPKLKVKIMPNLLDFKVTPVVQSTLRYDDAQGDIHKVETFAFTAPTEANWSFPIPDQSRRTYRMQTTYNTADGKVIKLPEVNRDETTLVLSKLVVPEVACLVVPKLIDLVQTPVVEVNVDYADAAHGIDFSDTLVFTDQNPQSFHVQVEEDSPREYQVAVTYYLADGQIVNRDPVTLDQSKIVIPRYVATV
jgi:hypothetical protein